MDQPDEATKQEIPAENPAAPARCQATARFIWIELTELRAALAAYRTKEAPMMDPTQPAAPAQPPTAPQGVTVCITSKPDGTFAVYQDADEGQEGASDDESAEQAGAQSAPDVDSALKLAKQMMGGVPAQPGTGNDDAEALFQGGFAGARGQLNKG